MVERKSNLAKDVYDQLASCSAFQKVKCQPLKIRILHAISWVILALLRKCKSWCLGPQSLSEMELGSCSLEMVMVCPACHSPQSSLLSSRCRAFVVLDLLEAGPLFSLLSSAGFLWTPPFSTTTATGKDKERC